MRFSQLLGVVVAYLCISTSIGDDCKDEIEELKQLVLKVIDYTKPPMSATCADVLMRDNDAKTGYYTLEDNNGEEQRVFCQMGTIPDSGCGDGAWRRVAYFNREKSSCPPELLDYTYEGKKTCSNRGGCNVIQLPVNQKYTRVCGRVRGYGVTSPDGFQPGKTNKGINTPYLDGISVSYGTGSSLNHLWSYATSKSSNAYNTCPCAVTPTGFIPSFVGDNYYCDGAANRGVEDILWDGKLCHPNEQARCCNHPKQPWFEREIAATSDPIQLRVCTDQELSDERMLVFHYEFYVQ